jgi:hypothetical protein
MTIASGSTLPRMALHQPGSNAANEPWYSRVRASWPPETTWPDRYVQSSAVTISGTASARAVFEAFLIDDPSVTSIPVRSTPIAQYVAVPEEAATSKPAAQAIALLDEWLADDSSYDEDTWPELKAALNQDRLSARRLFDD